ncbi:MAG: DUF1949 domain-containing protein, partial [Chloroflexi bacterium]|nr:DUF1949 domain-containing protein [Chloroflexota bacterium]
EGSGLVQVVAVVTRYFGGVKLGTGGLVRAYGGAVREALKTLDTAERVLHQIAALEVGYDLYGTLRYQLPRLGVVTQDERFADTISMTIAIPYDRAHEVRALLQELSSGQIALDQRRVGYCYL